MQKKTYTAVVHKEGDWYVAQCPEVGTASQGKSLEDAVANLKEATELYIEEFGRSENLDFRPVITTFDIAINA